MKELTELIRGLSADSFSKDESLITFYHPDNKEIGIDLDIEIEKGVEYIDEKILSDFLSTKYVTGQYIIRENYFETVVDFSNIFDLYDRDSTSIKPCGHNYEDKPFYEIGDISNEFDVFLKQSIYWDNFSSEYFKSIKLHNINQLITDNYKSEAFMKKISDYLSVLFFQLSTRYDLKIKLLDLGDSESFEPEFEEFDTSEIESTIIANNDYDLDLIKYYNRAFQMSDSSFKYLAFFQVIECLFDEVFREETIQDAKAIINSNWFDSHNSDNILQLIKLIDKFSKEQNDRTKIRLVLEKYLKMNIHDEAFLLAYSDISDKLIELDLIRRESLL
jgi:hypothetical protein